MITLLTAIWMVNMSSAVAAWFAGRYCFKARQITKNKSAFEWFTGLGVGFYLYTTYKFASTLNGVCCGPTDSAYSSAYVIQWLLISFLETFGMWTMALVMMNGSAPGKVRRILFYILGKLGKMKYKSGGPAQSVATTSAVHSAIGKALTPPEEEKK